MKTNFPSESGFQVHFCSEMCLQFSLWKMPLGKIYLGKNMSGTLSICQKYLLIKWLRKEALSIRLIDIFLFSWPSAIKKKYLFKNKNKKNFSNRKSNIFSVTFNSFLLCIFLYLCILAWTQKVFTTQCLWTSWLKKINMIVIFMLKFFFFTIHKNAFQRLSYA